ncbi:hypothetical protein IHE45_13G030000 [Dioscorea alata]|uniref:Uncharacterized protein n=1 Tax=Dioscorea alata TaxID=55571 RepID=A0ACB7UX70_DIOAL|nr:hypothetical protein IHE45_13G030000 [Dioscorea alata]
MDQEEGKTSSAFTFDVEEDEALSLSDLPVSTSANEDKVFRDKNEESTIKSQENEEFEFRTWGSSGLCVADEVFFKGRILPLRPSISSDTCVFGPSRSSSSSSRSSSCISRSHSSSSSSTGGQIVAPRPHAMISNNFYAHPSPSPQLRRANAGRKSTGSAPVGWSVFRLGLVQAPEIEIHNLRARRVASVESSSTSTIGSRSFRELCFSSVVKAKSVSDHQNNGKVVEEKKGPLKFFGLGFACKCSPDSVEKHEQKMMMVKSKKKKKSSSEEKRGESVRQRRIFEWLEELSVARMMV